MVTYLIDVYHISLGNVVGHYGCPKAVEKTVSHMLRKLRLLRLFEAKSHTLL